MTTLTHADSQVNHAFLAVMAADAVEGAARDAIACSSGHGRHAVEVARASIRRSWRELALPTRAPFDSPGDFGRRVAARVNAIRKADRLASAYARIMDLLSCYRCGNARSADAFDKSRWDARILVEYMDHLGVGPCPYRGMQPHGRFDHFVCECLNGCPVAFGV